MSAKFSYFFKKGASELTILLKTFSKRISLFGGPFVQLSSQAPLKSEKANKDNQELKYACYDSGPSLFLSQIFELRIHIQLS